MTKRVLRCLVLPAVLLVSCAFIAAAPATVDAQAPAPAKAASSLADSDCVKCHDQQPADVAKAGSAHKEDVTCSDCHEGHRPTSQNNIPQCSDCHEDEPHFALENCLGCHTNPHTPLIITIAKGVTDPCLTCHDEQIEKLKATPSKHTAQACSNCHDVHGKIPDCTACHKPHSNAMTQADCSKCHEAHQPTAVVYNEKVPNKDCGACHAKALELLTASKTKHQQKPCVFCHKAKHKTIATCESCHKRPHPEGILNKFPTCGDCHKIAHDLNNWPVKAAAPARKKQ